jgi:DNA-binding LytR/AlgR family response regulator
MQVILIEDELYNLRLLQGMIAKLRPRWQIIKTFGSVKHSVAWLRSNPHPDLFFMDIQLADGLCFSIFDQVRIDKMVIFTTAYDNYAIQAFKVNSIDYLLKPFREKDLEAAIKKFENYNELYLSGSPGKDYSDVFEAIRRWDKKYRKRFLISRGDAFMSLRAGDIAYFYSENRITTAVTFSNNNYIIDFTLDALEEELDPELFFRANRQVIVNINAIERIEKYFAGKLKVLLKSPFKNSLLISRLKSGSFKQWAGK